MTRFAESAGCARKTLLPPTTPSSPAEFRQQPIEWYQSRIESRSGSNGTHLRAVEGLPRLHVGQDRVAHHHRVHVFVGAGRDHQVRVVGQALHHPEPLVVGLKGLHGGELNCVVPEVIFFWL